ncbi:lipopolysaccharide assembly protein LapA domain-containing protein [Lysobacter solisilvae (ex Woo and Kim 2020)]|uniref:DUF1049 domain-containing protein n=1 Tax=Agrilutibacter terrestris TaxID=2865112 RepID=A0A7H0FX78_9GAMM|nr:lipopolysaccharide assembly protein LapA domain-containing protein [Lysobacter terrestris]QNP40644.1 DUF1049 domain-containing protein [Lysobacter terrestris]
MGVIRLLVAFVCMALGAIIGALNRQATVVDLGAAQVSTTLGVALLVALLLGVLLGGSAIAASVVLPLRRQLARANRQPGSMANTGT